MRLKPYRENPYTVLPKAMNLLVNGLPLGQNK